jgi:hypothetical protein
VAHISVLSLPEEPYVDPEDWSPRRVVFLIRSRLAARER